MDAAVLRGSATLMSDHDYTYSAKLATLLRRSQRRPQTFVDAGACHGDFTALLAQAFPEASIHAFEPNPGLSESLARRFASEQRIRTWGLALRAKAGRADLLVHADPGTSSLLPRPGGERRYFSSQDKVIATESVDTTSLDEFIASQVPEGVALLKLDTQGSELAILEGATSALESAAIEVVYTEFFFVPHYAGAPLLSDLMAFLDRFGYSIFDLFKGPNASNGQLRFGDAIFVSPEFRALYLDTSPAEP